MGCYSLVGERQDAKPANVYAEEAVVHMESAQKLYIDLDELGTGVRDRHVVNVNTVVGKLLVFILLYPLKAASASYICYSALTSRCTCARRAHWMQPVLSLGVILLCCCVAFPQGKGGSYGGRHWNRR